MDLTGLDAGTLQEYVHRGGTLVVNVEAARALPRELLGVRLTGKTAVAEEWAPDGGAARVDRRAAVDVVLHTTLPVRSAKEYTRPHDLTPVKAGDGLDVPVHVEPGDVQVIALVTGKQ